jgi:D-alanyl-D-alanine dipeptidase
MKVYISGMITALKHDEYRNAFKATAKLIEESGHTPVDPSDLGKPEHRSWHYYMKKAIPQLCDCDAIYMLNNYRKSRGAKLELTIAEGLDMPVFYQMIEETADSQRLLNLDIGNYGQEEIR